MWIEHGGVVHVLALPGQRRLDGQSLNVHVGLHEARQLRREPADRLRRNSSPVRDARDFNATLREAVEETVIHHVAVEGERLAGLERVDDPDAELVATGYVDDCSAFERGLHGLPLLDLSLAAAGVFVEGNVELLDQVRPVALDEPRDIFREVL